MAIIGKFTKDGAGYTGYIETLGLKAKITLEPNTNKRSEKAPDFRVTHIADGFTSEIGAAWTKTAKESHAQYESVSIDDPSLPEAINCRLVKTGTENGYSLFWERPEPKKDRQSKAA